MDAARARPTCAELLRDGATRLAVAGIATARLDAEVLLALAMQTDRSGLYARLPASAEEDVDRRFAALIDRRARREPIAYITGVQEFWSLPFAVNPSVLIPRPETELLVESVRRLMNGATAAVAICDVGTGSGCIAVALARELPSACLVAVDISDDALAVARRNAAANGVGSRVTLVASDLFEALSPDARFDVIVSNPPYCRPADPMSPEVAFEPGGALFADADGLRIIRRLIAASPGRLRPGGWLVMELGVGLDEAVRAQSEEAGLTDISVRPDLAGIPRVLVARRP